MSSKMMLVRAGKNHLNKEPVTHHWRKMQLTFLAVKQAHCFVKVL